MRQLHAVMTLLRNKSVCEMSKETALSKSHQDTSLQDLELPAYSTTRLILQN